MKKALLFCWLFSTLIYGQCPPGNVTFNTQADVDNFIATYPTCDIINGELFITGAVTDLSALDYLQTIDDALIIRNTQLTTISNFNTLSVIYNTIDIADNTLLETITGFNGLDHLSMLFFINNNPNLNTINGFNNATDVFFDFWIGNNPSLQSITGFSNLQNVGEFMAFNDCPQLTSIPSFNNLTSIGWSVQFYNTGMTDISGFENIALIGGFDPTSGFVISNNQDLESISGFCSLARIEYDLLIQDNPVLVDLSGLKSLESVGQFFTIRSNASLATLNGFQSLTEISRPGYEGVETVSIHDNPMLTDCDPLCNVLTSNQIIGIVNLNNNLTGCNSVAEINTTNCTPFETLACTSLTGPLDADINVAVDTNISWQPSTGATYYLISIGTTSGGVDIANRLNVGNITDYNLPNDLPPNTEIFVKVIPYSDTGNATCCVEESFTTETTPLECTTLNSPINNDTDVLVTTDISWDAIASATGYLLSIGTTPGGTDIANALDVGNVTTYDPTTDFAYNTQIFITIIPYNATEQGSGCLEESFVTEEEVITTEPPTCARLTNPINGAVNVMVNTVIAWNANADATGYILSIGTGPGTNDILDNDDVGAVTTFSLSTDLPTSTEIFVTIIPYNAIGQAILCLEESFTTENKAFRIPRFFTPNNDGFHDAWQIEDPENVIKAIYIFDRYGKLLKNLESSVNEWNGIFNGELLPVNDYWYVIELFSGKNIRGHFALKR